MPIINQSKSNIQQTSSQHYTKLRTSQSNPTKIGTDKEVWFSCNIILVITFYVSVLSLTQALTTITLLHCVLQLRQLKTKRSHRNRDGTFILSSVIFLVKCL